MRTITREQLKSKMKSSEAGESDDLTIINTLSEEQFHDTRIPGAINIPQEEQDFVDRVSSAVGDDKDAEIVVYCASSRCDSSTNAAKKLESAGFTNVFDYDGGAQDWQRAPQM